MEWTKFKLEIEIGNAAMESTADIAEALEHVARKLREGRVVGKVMDLNGNAVGTYGIE